MRKLLLVITLLVNIQLQASRPFCQWISSLPATLVDEAQCIFFDSQGLMWIGTLNGLKSYDGYQVRTYRNNGFDKNLLGHNRVRCITEDNNGRLWIGTNLGLTCLDKRTGNFVSYLPKQKNQQIIYMLHHTNDGTLWVGTDGGLLAFDKAKHRFSRLDLDALDLRDAYGSPTKVGNYSPKSMIEDKKNGNMYIGTWNDGIIRVSHDRKKGVCYRKTNRMNSAFDLHIDQNGKLWITTWGFGIERLDSPMDASKETLKTYPQEQGKWGAFSKLIEDTLTHTLWAVSFDGLSACDLQDDNASFLRFDHIGTEHSLQMATNIAFDATGSLWMTTTTEGVKHFSIHPSPFCQYPLPTKAKVNAIFTSDGLNLWIGLTPFGLIQYNRADRKRHYNAVQSDDKRFYNTLITSIINGPDGSVWIGSAGNGIKKVEKSGTVENIKSSSTKYLKEDYVTVLFNDNSGNMWIGQRGALGIVQLQRTLLHGSDIRDICEDRFHRIWVATDNDGIYCFDKGAKDVNRYKHYNPKSGNLPILDVASIITDGDGVVWASSNSGGLLRHVPQTDSFLQMDQKFGIENIPIYGLARDREGRLWISSEHGMYRVSKKKGTRGKNVDYSITTESVERISSGMNAMFSFGKELFVGTKNAFFSFQPSKVICNKNRRKANLYISNIYVDNAPWDQLDSVLKEKISSVSPSYTKSLIVPASISKLSIEFCLLNFSNATNQYAYKLEGYDKNWHQLENGQRRATFENLPSGTYQLYIRATDAFGIRTEIDEPLLIKILPPWYQTRWAYLIYILFFIGFIWLIVHLSRQHVKTKNRLAMGHIFTQITHELLTPLTVISASVDEMRNDAPQHERHYQMIQSNIDRLIRKLRLILEVRKSQEGHLRLKVSQGNLTALVSDTVSQIMPIANVAQVSIQLSCEEVVGWFDLDKLDKILYNLISNAIKYNRNDGKVEILLKKIGHHVQLIVRDTGIGIDKKKMRHLYSEFMDGDYRQMGTTGTGLGLSIIHDLVELHHGTIECQSEPWVGTTFIVELPIERNAYKDYEIATELADTPKRKEYFHYVDEWKPVDTDTDTHAPMSSASLLIVEDNKELLFIMAHMLSATYKIYKSQNGREAWNIIQQHDIDIVITDVMMPELNGIQLTHLIKESDDFSQLPVIMLTAKTSESDRNKGYSIGADEYITKPFKKADLLLRIDNILQNRERIRKHFCRNTDLEKAIENQHLSHSENQLLQRAADYVREHLETADRESMAQALCMSSSSLYNRLRLLTGQNVIGFITSIRMKEACRIMRQHPDMLISDVAMRVGISTPYYFTQCFKEEFGMTPSQFKNAKTDKR